MNADQRAALQKAVLFQGMSDEEFASLVSCLSPRVKHFTKNEIMLLTGDPVQHIGVMLCGAAHAYLEHIDGSQTLMADLESGRVFGEVLVSTGTHQSPVTIYAASDVTAAFIEYRKVYSFCTAACFAHRVFLQNMLKAIGDKYFNLFDRINILSEKPLRARIMAYLYTLSDNGKSSVVTIPFTKTMLADYLLADRCALSKELRKMERDGIIAVNRRNVEIKNI